MFKSANSGAREQLKEQAQREKRITEDRKQFREISGMLLASYITKGVDLDTALSLSIKATKCLYKTFELEGK